MSLLDAIAPLVWADTPAATTLGSGAGQTGQAVAGVDVGGTKIHLAVRTAGGQVVEESIATGRRGGTTVLDDIAAALARLAGPRGVSQVVLGAPGVPQQVTGRLDQAPNLPGWDRLDVPAELARRTGAAVALDNDVNLGAWGEHLWGGERDLVFIAVGTGLGAGIVQSGRIQHGAAGGAGEVYDIPLAAAPDDGWHTLEDLVCGPGLVRLYRERTGSRATTHEILDRLADDPQARWSVDLLGVELARLVVAAHALLDPQVVVLGGGLGSRPEIVAAVRDGIGRFARRPVALRPSHLRQRSATFGALAEAWERSTRAPQP